MPVIINDLEIIIEKAETAPASTDGPAPTEGESRPVERALTPRVLDTLDRHRRARAARIRGD